MQFEPTTLLGVIKIIQTVHEDSRGFLMETWQARNFADSGIDAEFVQENFSHSRKGTLRGPHYRIKQPQGRLERVVQGAVFDVSVDLRKSLPHFGRWFGEILSAENKHQLWVPPGFGIEWSLTPGEELVLSDKDAAAPNLKDAEIYP